jgi:hypothetical protein
VAWLVLLVPFSRPFSMFEYGFERFLSVILATLELLHGTNPNLLPPRPEWKLSDKSMVSLVRTEANVASQKLAPELAPDGKKRPGIGWDQAVTTSVHSRGKRDGT